MMSPKLMALMATMTLIGTGAPVVALADPQEFAADLERNNEVEQSQVACENDVSIIAEGDQIALVDAEQTNDCLVWQDQNGVIVDDSETVWDLQAALAEIGR